MQAPTEAAGSGRPRIVLALLAASLLLASAGALAVPAQAADDSNAGQLAQAPTVSPEQLNSALSSLAQGTNDTAVQQLLSQFQSQLSSGDYQGAASTLVQLKSLSSSDPNGVPPSLNALLQSLTVGNNNGASIDANTLASLLRSAPATSAGSQQRLSVDMQTLANLMQYVNSTMASQLLQSSDMLSQNAFAGGGSVNSGGSQIALPGVSTLPALSIPAVSAPSLSVGGASGAPPAIPLAALAVPLVAAAAVAALFLSRGRVVRLMGAQRLPDLTFLKGGRDEGEDEGATVPTEPRRRIEFYFARAVRLMAGRGVPKLKSETHREFSSKCEGTPERQHVTTISSLYEKAKFSGQGVGSPDADSAADAFFAMGKDER